MHIWYIFRRVFSADAVNSSESCVRSIPPSHTRHTYQACNKLVSIEILIIIIMVFTDPTKYDYGQASEYALERHKLVTYNHFLKSMPHIFSHVNIEIRHNKDLNNTDAALMNANIDVRLIGSRAFCQQISCNAYYPRGQSCSPNDGPLVFKSGNTDIAACQPACFRLFNYATHGDGVHAKAPLVQYSDRQQACLLQTDQIFRLGYDDYMRTDVHITPRIDTIGTGFDLEPEPYIDSHGNETFHFKLNKYYCDDFGYKFDGVKCEPSMAEHVSSALLSENLYKTVQYGHRYVNSGVGFFDVQKPTLPPIDMANLPPSSDEWRQNINTTAMFFDPNLRLSDLGITGDTAHLVFTTEYGWPGQLVEPVLLYRQPQCPHLKQINYTEWGKARLPQFAIDEYGRRLTDEYELMGVYEYFSGMETYTGSNDSNVERHLDTLMARTIQAVEAVAPQLGLYMGEKILLQLKRFVHNSANNAAAITPTLIKLAERTFSISIAQRTGFQAALALTSTSFKLTLSLLKVLSTALSLVNIIGWIDIVLITRDIFALRNLVNQRFVDAYSELDLAVKEKLCGFKSFEYSPAFFVVTYDGIVSANANKNGTDSPPANTSHPVPAAEELKQQANDFFPAAESGGHTSKYLNLLENAFSQKMPFAITANDVQNKNDPLQLFQWQDEYLHRLTRNSDGLYINWADETGTEHHQFDQFVDSLLLDNRNNRRQLIQSSRGYSTDFIDASSRRRFKYIQCGFVLVGICIFFTFLTSSILPPLVLTMFVANVIFSMTFSTIPEPTHLVL